MAYQNHKVSLTLSIISIILITIKLFTTEIWLNDDPTAILAIQFSPSLASLIAVDDIDRLLYMPIIMTENGFLGEGIYRLTTQYLWWISPLVGIIYYFVQFIKKLR